MLHIQSEYIYTVQSGPGLCATNEKCAATESSLTSLLLSLHTAALQREWAVADHDWSVGEMPRLGEADACWHASEERSGTCLSELYIPGEPGTK